MWATLKQDFQTVRAEAGRNGWRASIARTFTELDEFYLTDERRRRLAREGVISRAMRRTWWLLTSLFFKLTPARRLMLTIAILATLLSRQGDLRGAASNIHLVIIGAGLFLLVLMLELKDKLVARHELEAGRAVQRALMPPPSPSVRGWQMWLETRPANDVGGDLVDFLSLDADRNRLALADVAGKGLQAALLAARLQATLRALAPDALSLADVAQRTNRILYRDGPSNRFATLVYLEIQSRSGRVRVVNAGHMPPVILRRDRLEVLAPGAAALGVLPDIAAEEHDVDLDPGDVLLVYSDGVTEAMNVAGEFFGEDRLNEVLRAGRPSTARELTDRILEAVGAFVGPARTHDDLSLIALRREAIPAPLS